MSVFQRYVMSALLAGCVVGFPAAAKEPRLQKITGFRVPYMGVTDECVYLVWDNPADASADYVLFVNGERLPETASQNYARHNPMAALYRDAFYTYYTKKRVGFEMVRVNPTSFCLDGLTAETEYTFRVASVTKKGKVISQSDDLTVTTRATPAAVLNITKHEVVARDFLAFLTSEAADAVFEAVGFSPMHE